MKISYQDMLEDLMHLSNNMTITVTINTSIGVHSEISNISTDSIKESQLGLLFVKYTGIGYHVLIPACNSVDKNINDNEVEYYLMYPDKTSISIFIYEN